MVSPLRSKRLPSILVYLYCLLCLTAQLTPAKCSNANNAAGSGGGAYSGRHAYSLSTFSPSGNLDQVARAMRASTFGVPIVALSIPPSRLLDAPRPATGGELEPVPETTAAPGVNAVVASNSARSNALPEEGGVYLSVPLRFLTTFPFLIDDGTPRVVRLTSSVCAAHTGVGADGRALCDFAIKLALDHRYVYGEEISEGELLGGLADRVQEMTTKVGSRPYGCALLVGCLGGDALDDSKPAMYRVDPSGAVILLNSFDSRDSLLSNPSSGDNAVQKSVKEEDTSRRGSVAFLGNWDPLRHKREAIRKKLENSQLSNEEDVRNMLIDAARQTYMDELLTSKESSSQSAGRKSNGPVLFASFTRERGLQISCIIDQQN